MRILVPDAALRVLSRQLGGPTGPVGALVARMLNRSKRRAIVAAVESLDLSGDETDAGSLKGWPFTAMCG